MKYISEEIGEEYKTWENGNDILIRSQTGSGKTTFILYVLLKYVTEEYVKSNLSVKTDDGSYSKNPNPKSDHENEFKIKIIYLCNRIALENQIEKIADDNFKRIISEIETENPEIQFTVELNDVLDICTYQSLEDEYRISTIVMQCKKNSKTFIVFDECHYIFDDSTFNPKTAKWYDLLNRIAKRAIKVFISATPDEVIHIIEKDKRLKISGRLLEIPKSNIDSICKRKSRKSIDENDINELEKLAFNNAVQEVKDFLVNPKKDNIIIYPNKQTPEQQQSHYKYVTPFVFDEWDELVSIIISSVSKTNDKWLIFVDSKDIGYNLTSVLNVEIASNKSTHPSDLRAVFLHAGVKKEKNPMNCSVNEFDTIRSESRFNSRILVTTSVLINGINLIDNEIKNVVIPYTEKVQFLQALGRVRVHGQNTDYKINLYVKRASYHKINTQRERLKDKLLHLTRFYNLQIPTPKSVSTNPEKKIYLQLDYDNIYANYFYTKFSNKYRRNALNNFTKYNDCLRVAAIREEGDREKYEDNPTRTLMEFCINETSLFHNLYLYCIYDDILENYNTENDEAETTEENYDKTNSKEFINRYFFFKEQLKWLGQLDESMSENDKYWIKMNASYNISASKLTDFVNKYLDKQITGDDIIKFRKELYEILKIVSPSVFYKDKSRYDKALHDDTGSLPGLKKLNKSLNSFGYIIERSSKKRKTAWTLTKIQTEN